MVKIVFCLSLILPVLAVAISLTDFSSFSAAKFREVLEIKLTGNSQQQVADSS